MGSWKRRVETNYWLCLKVEWPKLIHEYDVNEFELVWIEAVGWIVAYKKYLDPYDF